MKNVLITGATGFIGGHLVERFIRKNDNVRALIRPGNRFGKELEQKGVEVIRGDVREYKHVVRAMSNIDTVIHGAAVVTDWAETKEYQEVTVGGTRNICRAATKENVGRLVHISTNSVFGRSEESVMDESYPFRYWREPYPDHKIKAEEICWLYHREQRTPVTMVYPCWVYGKNDYTFVADLADAILKKEMIFWRKKALIWPTYVDNLVDLIVKISEDECAVGNGYLAHDGESITLQGFCEKIAETLDVPPITRHLPYPMAYAYAKLLETTHTLLRKKTRPLLTTYIVKALGSRLRFSIDKADRELGWKPSVSFEDGFKHTMEWLKTVDPKNLKTK
ncbi:MAG: NAD-dependent epimerase/dehydratase family protein [Deltaproteobacteria bacterium]|jgi:2-alkyl-3-oxoalkanoate reductase|nr:NAD-dependent epimerase/dehydratase family protein [Deltaproteobacteria bacterium]MBT7151770.1 NAD-dependent epimerase/dehydratase family protein [Deltaproteobacteria bacterium]